MCARGRLSVEQDGSLATAARERPDAAGTALAEALALREALAELLPGPPAASSCTPALVTLNGVLAAAMADARIEPVPNGYARTWRVETSRLEAPTWPIARAAADLLVTPERGWVRACANAECGWLFLDGSRGHRRRWCSMESCGNRAKARRHYARARAREAPDSA